VTVFTDWTLTDPHYFYLRGALWGIVVTTIFWKLLVPWFKRHYKKYKEDKEKA
jgi:ATP/ADP translocase